MSAGAPSPDSRHACSPSASDSRCSSWRTRALSRMARSWAASRSACRDARVTAGPAVSRGRRGGFGRVDLLQQVAVPVEEGAVDAGGAGDARCADLGAAGGRAVEGGQDALPAPGGVGLAAFAHRLGARAGDGVRCWLAAGHEARPFVAKGGPRGRAEAGHADADGAVLADDGDGLVDAGPVGRARPAMSPLMRLMSCRMTVISWSAGAAWSRAQCVDAGGGGEPFAGAEQVIEVGGQVGEVGHVGAEVVAAGAAEPDRAVGAAGGDVGRLGAGAVGDGDGADRVAGVLVVQQRAGVTPDPVAVPVELHRGDLVDGAAAAFFADPVVAAGDVEVAMVEQLGEDVDRDARIGVPLGVGVPVGVRDSAALVEFTAAVQQQRSGSEVSQSRCAVDSAETVSGRRPSRLAQLVGSSFSSLAGVPGNRSRTRCCWARISAAVAERMGSRRPSRCALWLS